MLLLFGIVVILTRSTCANLEFANFESPVDFEDTGRYVKFDNIDNPSPLWNNKNEDNADEEENSAGNNDDRSNFNVESNDCDLASHQKLALYYPGELEKMLLKCLILEKTSLKDTLRESANKRRKRSIGYSENESRINNKNKRGSSSISTWLNFPAQDKAIPIQERQEPSQEKKSPAFNPWGGKRMMILSANYNNQRPIRTPFNSWGGKRNDESFGKFEQEKRGKFFNWGGKRFPFNSWGGKRGMSTVKQRVPFHSWGGKREWKLEEELEEIEKRSKSERSDDLDVKRTKFNAWGGKRSDPFYSWLYKRIPEEVIDKRNPFRSWSVKRDVIETDDDMETKNVPQENEVGRRVRFNSWGGKRYNNNPIVESPETIHGDWRTLLRSFESWQDKRSRGTDSILNSDTSLIPESISIRKIFFPWGG